MIHHITVKPNARINQILISPNGDIKVKVKAPATEGKSNKELVRYLSELFEVSKSAVQIIKGHTSSHKKLEIVANEEKIKAILGKQIIHKTG